MDINALVPGDRVIMEDGSLADVISPSQDGVSVRVRYVECPFDPALVGTQAIRDEYDILAYVAGAEVNSAAMQTVDHQPPSGGQERASMQR
jgi:hypothetical protein